MNTMEQIVICKLMLFSYIYHHPEVRAADGLLERMLERLLRRWRGEGVPDTTILARFLDMTDSALQRYAMEGGGDELVKQYAYRLVNRLIPREVYGFSSAAGSGAEGAILTDFITDLQDRDRRDMILQGLERAVGEELVKVAPELGEDAVDGLAKAGVWIDAPKAPKFEDVDELVIGGALAPGVALLQIFPIGEWTQAYMHYRYQVRVFAFSEYLEKAKIAAKKAMQRIIRIEADAFYEAIARTRT